MKTSRALLGLLQGESLFIHMVPEEKAIKVTAKFIRPNATSRGPQGSSPLMKPAGPLMTCSAGPSKIVWPSFGSSNPG